VFVRAAAPGRRHAPANCCDDGDNQEAKSGHDPLLKSGLDSNEIRILRNVGFAALAGPISPARQPRNGETAVAKPISGHRDPPTRANKGFQAARPVRTSHQPPKT